MDPDIAMMIPGFLVLAFLVGVYVGHSIANTPGNRWLKENRKQAAARPHTEK